jgi:hypothetical protein
MAEANPVRVAALAPWASDTHPTDVSREHVEEVTAGTHEYVITQGGSMDGENCRTPHGSWEPMVQTWESNRAVRMENVGESDVVNPWLSNGRNGFRSIKEIVDGAVHPGMSDREKAIALYYLEVNQRFHAHTGDDECSDPVKVFNIYGFTTCGHDAICLAGLWRQAGLGTRPARAVGHVITQVFYDNAWHLMDADMQCVYLMRDNHTIAGLQEIARDHDLVKRTHAEGLLRRDDRAGNEWEASLFVYEGDAGGTRDATGRHTMAMTLRPGEALTWRWGQLRPVKYHGVDDIAAMFGQEAADTICNGLWEYRPDFTQDVWRAGAEAIENVQATPTGLAGEAGKTGIIVWRMRSPYVFVGGRLEVEGSGARFSLSWDGDSWQEVGEGLDELFPREGPARYQYQLRCELSGGGRLVRLAIVNDLQMAPLALPGMVVGDNRFLYTDESSGERRVRITHQWVERSASVPPGSSPGPIFPPDGGETEGTDIVFQWMPPADPDGEGIADYHFELSEYPDMRWPLSPNFRKLISNTADRGKPRFTLPYVGLLAPDREYYWRVRAKNKRGVWGPWNRPWSFTARAPGPPLKVTLDFDAERGIGSLRWRPNPVGRAPARYRVYGSSEKGFSVSDEPYAVMDFHAGDWRKARLTGRFPANFVAETTATELVVVGQGLDLPNANRAFYRVVAVDEHGNRSWSSDYAAAPRPFIYTTPVPKVKVGEQYCYQVATIRSLGDLGMRDVTEEQVAEFWPPEERSAILRGPSWHRQVVKLWDIQEPRYALLEGPTWLKLDEETGLLSGRPEAAGRVHVVVAATLRREVQELDLERLAWGHRQVTRVTTERMGPVTQKFVIEVTY